MDILTYTSETKIEDTEKIINNEIIADTVSTLNKHLNNENELIVCINIRSLNCNYNKLLTFLKSLILKPCIIICTETWNMDHHHYFNISGYKIFYNNSRINQNDGVVMYIDNNLIETTEVTEINKPKIINSIITIDNNEQILISALYRRRFTSILQARNF